MEEAEEIGHLNFNQHADCFFCSTASGFRVYNTDPTKQTIRRDLEGVELSIVEMVFRSNVFALVARNTSTVFAPNNVIVWDDEQNCRIGELRFRSEVRSVRLRRDRVVVAVEHKVHIINFNTLTFMRDKEIQTFTNPRGVCAISTDTNMFVLACPGRQAGEVCLKLFDLDRTIYIQAHRSPLAQLALSRDGRLLATTSIKGTVIRIFDTDNGTKLQELRRGTEKVDIQSMTISSDCHWLVLSSDKGTVHVFSLLKSQGPVRYPVVSSLVSLASNSSLTKGIVPSYLTSDTSFAQFRLPKAGESVVAFGAQKNSIVVVCKNGSYYKCSFDPSKGGEMKVTESAAFT